MNTFLRDGFGTMVSAAIASAFYAGPLVVMVLAGGGGVPARAPADVGPADDYERIVVWQGDPAEETPAAAEEPEVEPVLAEVVEPTERAVPVKDAAPADEAEEAAGGAAGEAPGTAEVGGRGEGTGNGDGAGPGLAGKGEAAKSKPAKRKRPSGCSRPHPNIREGADGVMEIDRSLVEKYTKNLETFMRLGFSRPHDEGDLRGWYISGFSCVSVVHKAGFRRGDVLLSVNGKKTRSWVGVFMMYQKLKNKEAFEVELVRKGEPMRLRFRVVDG